MAKKGKLTIAGLAAAAALYFLGASPEQILSVLSNQPAQGPAHSPRTEPVPAPPPGAALETTSDSSADRMIASAFRNRRSDVLVEGSATVKAILPDDREGSRHQRFILELDNGHTVLIAHNIDLAPRVKDLRRGTRIEFRGEYEWNEKGGVIHWTHADPQGRHPGGWLRYEGEVYR